MKPSTLTLQGLFGPDVRYLVPLYQRPYVWQRKSHWEPLWQDVVAVLERHLAGEETRGHFLGAVVLEQEATNVEEVDRRLVIDGQQRLTTLQLLLAAAAAQAAEDGAERVGRLLRRLVRNDEDLVAGDERFKVWPTNADRAEFAAVMGHEDGEPPTSPGSEGIGAAYDHFRGAIRRWVREDGADAAALAQRHEALRAVLAGLLQVVSINLERGDDAQVIFETLNARGTPLLAMDLVKNAIFHRAEAEASDAVDALHHDVWEPELGRSYWRESQRQGRLNRPRAELFLMHWLTMQLRDAVPATELFSRFRERVLDGPASPPTAELIAELCADAATMRGFDALPVSSPDGIFFRRLAVLDTTTLLPLALLLFRPDALAPERRARALAALESWLVRRMLCSLTTKNYNRLAIELLEAAARDLPRADETIVALLDAWDAPTNRWPRDDEVVRCLTTRYAYGWIAQRRLVMVLDAVERRRRSDSGKTESILDPQAKLSIEHAMPQEWRTHWPPPDGGDDDVDADDAARARDALLHHLGNLTLVTGPLNASLSNAAWEAKRDALADHSLLLLNAELAKRETWDERAIRARSRALADEVCAIWLPPPTYRPLPESSASASERAYYRWTIGDLVEAGKLAVGERLVPPPGRDSAAVATVADDGTLELDGELFRTPSAAAKRVSGRVAEHGWRFWRVERDGRLLEIDALREELGAEED